MSQHRDLYGKNMASLYKMLQRRNKVVLTLKYCSPSEKCKKYMESQRECVRKCVFIQFRKQEFLYTLQKQ